MPPLPAAGAAFPLSEGRQALSEGPGTLLTGSTSAPGATTATARPRPRPGTGRAPGQRSCHHSGSVRCRTPPAAPATVTSAAENATSNAIPHSSSGLLTQPDAGAARPGSVRAAIAVPTWQATIPRNVIVVACRQAVCSGAAARCPRRGSSRRAQQREQEQPGHQDRRDPAQQPPGPGQHRAVDRPSRRRGRAARAPSGPARRARGRARGRAGSRCPRSMARICITVSGSGIAPPASA